MHGVNQYLDVLGRGKLGDAMAEIEDMPAQIFVTAGIGAEAVQDAPGFGRHFVRGCDQ